MDKNAPKGKMLEDFLSGVFKGFNMSVKNQLPAFIFAFTLIYFMDILGLMDLIGKIFNPIMGIFGLPGEAGAVLAGAWVKSSVAIPMLASMFTAGKLTAPQVAIMVPMSYMIGGQIQAIGRQLVVNKTPKKHYIPICIMGFLTMIIIGILGRIFNGIFY